MQPSMTAPTRIKKKIRALRSITLHRKSRLLRKSENDSHLLQCSDQPKIFTKCSYSGLAISPIEPMHSKTNLTPLCVTLQCKVFFGGCRVQLGGCRVQLGCGVQLAGCRVQLGRFRLQLGGCRVQLGGCRVQLGGCRVQR